MRYALLLLCPVHTSLSTDVLVKFYSARAPRRFERGLTRKTIALIKKLRKAKREAPPCEKPEQVHTLPRNMIIVLEMIGSIIGVYNGKTFKHIAIKPEMIGHYLAEFSMSYKPVKHGELDEKRVQEQRALDCLISLGSIQDTSAHQNEDAIFPLSSNNTDKSLPSLPVPNHLYHIVSEIVTHNELFSRGENGVYAKFNRMQKMAHGTAMNNARKSSVRPSSARNSVSSPIIAKNSSYGRSAYSLRLSGISTSDFSPSLDASQPNYRLEKLAFKKQANSFCQLAKMISPEWLYVLIGSIHSVVCGSLVPSLLMFLVLPLVSITVQTTDT